MEHLQAHASSLDILYPIARLGALVPVDSMKNGGYVSLLTLMLEAAQPEREVVIENFAVGGSTSRDVLEAVRRTARKSHSYSIAFIGCGTNDIWRAAQNRTEEAVDEAEFRRNVEEI